VNKCFICIVYTSALHILITTTTFRRVFINTPQWYVLVFKNLSWDWPFEAWILGLYFSTTHGISASKLGTKKTKSLGNDLVRFVKHVYAQHRLELPARMLSILWACSECEYKAHSCSQHKHAKICLKLYESQVNFERACMNHKRMLSIHISVTHKWMLALTITWFKRMFQKIPKNLFWSTVFQWAHNETKSTNFLPS